ncbi:MULTISPECIES: hypothetical protein [Thiomonas]|jgi:hypothetical protein|uniref:hypothetical protein n=1 Tax=Thiomonas TaxID=32012 RepID=UPI000AE5E3F9|nr:MULTISPECIES: hypothetical protein [Thiomonas]HML81752.1 hypothetical protein [Thiomonas arsenitoxydans]
MTDTQAAPCMLQAWQFAEAEVRGFVCQQLHDGRELDQRLSLFQPFSFHRPTIP